MPDTRHPVGAVVLGAHLHHLRTCQGLTATEAAERFRGPARPTAGDLTAWESGHLAPAAAPGLLAAYLRVLNTGQVALADYEQVLEQCPADAPGRAFKDNGAASSARYQILESSADSLLLLASGTLPDPLRTERTQAAASFEAAVTPAAPGPRLARALSSLPSAGCEVCVAYRSDLLTDTDMAHLWQQATARARCQAFGRRIRTDGPTTVLLLGESVLDRGAVSTRAHADQLTHLLGLQRTTNLQIRILPRSSEAGLTGEKAELRFGQRTLTATVQDTSVRYDDGRRDFMTFALQRALDADVSAALLDRAACGTLRRGDWPAPARDHAAAPWPFPPPAGPAHPLT